MNANVPSLPIVCLRFDRDWKKIEAFVGSKTVIQVLTKGSFLFVLETSTSLDLVRKVTIWLQFAPNGCLFVSMTIESMCMSLVGLSCYLWMMVVIAL